MTQAGSTTRSDLTFLDGLQLNHRERLFVVSYVELGNGAEAARRAGYSPRSARQKASDLLTKVNIKFAVARARKTVEASTMIRAEEVAARWWGIANASPADVIQSRRVACRYCHGTDHEYQWRTPREYREALDAKLNAVYPSQDARESAEALIQMGDWDVLPLSIPRNTGGFGYSASLDPIENCPECDGLGYLHTWVADTRDLSDATLALFDGVKETQHGIERKFQDRGKALESIVRHLGMFAISEDNPFGTLNAASIACCDPQPWR